MILLRIKSWLLSIVSQMYVFREILLDSRIKTEMMADA